MLDRFEQFTTSISGIYRSIQKIERDEMEKYGLKGAYAQYLLAMTRHPDGMTAATLCEVCEKDKAAISRILSEMEHKGLVIRESGSYRSLVRLTEAGKAAARFVQEKAIAAAEIASSVLTEEDRTHLYDILSRLSGKLQGICKDGIPPVTMK